MKKFELIAFDADDTLWHNESIYHDVQEKFAALLSGYASRQQIEHALFDKEMANLARYGYGIKSFTLSMIETAIDLTQGSVSGEEIKKIISFAHNMLGHEIQLLEGVPEVIRELSESHPLMLLTKGDLLDQEIKLARSGLGGYFCHFEVVSTKEPHTYQAVLKKYGVRSDAFLMVGNSLKSDVLPVVDLGGYGVYIPYSITWAHEAVEYPSSAGKPRWFELEHIGLVPRLVHQLEHS